MAKVINFPAKEDLVVQRLKKQIAYLGGELDDLYMEITKLNKQLYILNGACTDVEMDYLALVSELVNEIGIDNIEDEIFEYCPRVVEVQFTADFEIPEEPKK